MLANTVHLGFKSIEIWPEQREVEICGDPVVRRIFFTDIQEYHPRLVAKILELEENQRLRKRYFWRLWHEDSSFGEMGEFRGRVDHRPRESLIHESA